MQNNASIKKNLLMNVILTGSQYIFPLITFPYVSRVLLAAGNGQINFAQSISSYFMLFASLGIPTYGVRACAIVREDRDQLSRTVHELLFINTVTCIAATISLFMAIAFVPKLQNYAALLVIFSVQTWLTCIGMDWLFQALEDYSYITKRSLIFKVIGILLMFIFVHSSEDVEKYAVTIVIGSSGSLVLNLIKSREYIDYRYLGGYNPLRHLKPILTMFGLSAAWTLYTNVDSAMLGFMTSDTEVGYYGAAIKIKTILASTISALGTVLLPRLSNYYLNNKTDEFYALLRKDGQFISVAAFGIVFFFIYNAEPIILFLSGEEYRPAIPVMQTIMLAVIFIGYSTMLGNNVLVPQKRETITIAATLVGFVFLVAFNALLIPVCGAFGSAVATVIGEAVIVCFELIYLRRELKKILCLKSVITSVASASLAVLVLLFFGNAIELSNFSLIAQLLMSACIYCLAYAIFLSIMGEELSVNILNNIKNKFLI